MSLLKRPIGIVALVGLILLALLIWAQFWSGGLLHSVLAQDAQPTIHSVEPSPPSCLILNSDDSAERTLIITGSNLGAGPDTRLQFWRRLNSQKPTFLFGDSVSWEGSELITLDMALAEEHLDSTSELFFLQVRLADANTGWFSNWSDHFMLARNETDCIKEGQMPIHIPAPGPFPSTSPVRGEEGDLWADIVIGKPDFSQTGPKSVVPFKVNNPGGVVVDRSVEPGRVYVWDSGNNRILGIDLAKCYEGEGACSSDIVIGQPSAYDRGSCNDDSSVQHYPVRSQPTAKTLCGIPDHSLSPAETYSFVTMAVDGNRSLYVPDSFNNRVLKYEDPFESDSIADQVWGQSDFSGQECNRGNFEKPTAQTLCLQSVVIQSTLNRFGSGVDLDAEGNLWVADTGNNRILRFPTESDSGEIAETADLVLGQFGFNSKQPGSSLRRLHAPSAVRFDLEGRLLVADAANDRVLVFEPPFESWMEATATFGTELHHPTSIEIDPAGRGIWIVDASNYMVELWNTTEESVVAVLGKDSFMPDKRCGPPMRGVPGGAHLCPIGGSIGIDGQGNVLVPVYHDAADVFRFPTSGLAHDSEQSIDPEGRLFFPPYEDNFRDRYGIHGPRGIATWQDQLIVSDRKRLMFWNGLSTLSNGRPADGIVGDEFAAGGWHYCCGRIKVDGAGRLWVLGFDGRDFLDVYQLPLTEFSVPIHTIWRESTSFPVLGTEDEITLGLGVLGIAPVGRGEFLWLSDTVNHRVLRIRDPLTSPVVDVVLGQDDASSTECNQGKSDRVSLRDLCYPGGLSIDRMGNLYVSDHALEVEGNFRLLIFEADTTPTATDQTIFGPLASSEFRHSTSGLSNVWNYPHEPKLVIPQHRGRLTAATWEPAFDSTNRMVVGYNAYVSPRFVGVYEDPLEGPELPDFFLNDYGSMYYTATFDDNDNLYVGDMNRGRVLVYKNPFNNPPVTAADSPPLEDIPNPTYLVSIESVEPEPPFCVIRQTSRAYERKLELVVTGLPEQRFIPLEFRKLISLHREHFTAEPVRLEDGRSLITVDLPHFWERIWSHIGRVTLTVRVLDRSGGQPISNWSPAFLLADDVGACGFALPTSTPIPTPTPTNTPIPSPTPTATATAIPSPTPTLPPTIVPSPTPTEIPTPSPTVPPVIPTVEGEDAGADGGVSEPPWLLISTIVVVVAAAIALVYIVRRRRTA